MNLGYRYIRGVVMKELEAPLSVVKDRIGPRQVW